MFQLKENQQSLHSRTCNLLFLDYHTIHHLTHTAVTRLASYWTARLRYLLLTVFSFKSLSVHTPPTYHQRFLNVCWAFKLITCGYEPPVTDASKPNKQIYQKFSATVFIHLLYIALMILHYNTDCTDTSYSLLVNSNMCMVNV
jgi:hypothetical protein